MFHAAGSRLRFGLLHGTWVDVAALHLSSFARVTFLTVSFYSLQFTAAYFIVLLLSAFVHYLLEALYTLRLID